MTVIAYRDGVMAADSMGSADSVMQRGTRKVTRSSTGIIAGFSGVFGAGRKFLRWVEAGAVGDPPLPREHPGDPDHQSYTGIYVMPDGRVIVVDSEGADERFASYLALGAGSAAALGAMFAGADAETAVRAAIEHCAWCGGDVDVVRLTG